MVGADGPGRHGKSAEDGEWVGLGAMGYSRVRAGPVKNRVVDVAWSE
jgi:hypothetical protein